MVQVGQSGIINFCGILLYKAIACNYMAQIEGLHFIT